MLYVKKPIPVNAVQWFPDVKHPAVMMYHMPAKDETAFFLPTIENQMLFLSPGCYIVGPGAKGEYWPVDKEVFEATYEEYKN